MHLNDLLKYINDFLGIYYPENRAHELEKLISHAARDSNFQKTDEFVDFLFSVPQPERISLLAKYLTIGETYFFRENATFEALKPEMTDFVRSKGSLDIWSAGCCTGEEPYSIAILLRELFPHTGFRLNITATDINRDFLKRARHGVYSSWSFRGVPEIVKKNYFTPAGENRFRIADEIKNMVSFSFLNLAENNYQFPHHSGKFDIIFCRNVIMYFGEELRNKVVNNFYELLNQHGFLALGIAEISNYYTQRFARVNYENTVLFRKKPALIKRFSPGLQMPAVENPYKPLKTEIKSAQPSKNAQPTQNEKPRPEKPVQSERSFQPLEVPAAPSEEARYLFESGEYEKAINILLTDLSIPLQSGQSRNKRIEAFEILIRALTSAGDIPLAIDWCRKGIEENKLSPAFYILLANLLNVTGDIKGAIEELKRAVYLEPGSFLSHFYLANIYRKKNEPELSRRHLSSALNIIRNLGQDEVLPETEGITAGRMKVIIEKQLESFKNK